MRGVRRIEVILAVVILGGLGRVSAAHLISLRFSL